MKRLAIYTINGKRFNIYGYWERETPEGEFSRYNVYDKEGNCLHEGLSKFPTWEEIKNLYA